MIAAKGYAISEVVAEDRRAVLFRARQGENTYLIRGSSQEYPSAEDLARLAYGANVGMALDLPGVLKVHGVEKSGRRLLVLMEDFAGKTLRSLMAERRLLPAEALTIAVELARTLGELHQQPVVHKNLEPGNILVAPDLSAIKITNFDIASRLSLDNPALTSARRLEGNLPYISPEQTGRMNRTVDYRTDFYSLGVTLYEMLTGQVPFRALDAITLVYSHIAVAPVPPCEVDPHLPRSASDVVMKLLAKNADDRYQSSYGLVADLKRCLELLSGAGGDARVTLGGTPKSAPAPFVPGLHDVSASFRIPQKLYGRARELATLFSAFERAAAGAPELVVVAGYSGVGKSALVHEIQEPILKRRGAFCAGKYNQLQNAPYSAILAAFRELVREELTESEEDIAALSARLSAALGSNGQLIVDVIPEVAHILGPQAPVPALGSTEAQNRFNLVLSQFVGALAREDRPLAIFLDDLQWADSASLSLIDLILGDQGQRHLLVIGAYRDNEVVGAHPLALALAEIKKGPCRVSDIAVRPLDLGDVTQIVGATLGRAQDPALRGIAELVFEKTAGNPFFVNQFLRSLHDRELLSFDPERGEWQWSVPRIREERITDNVAELVSEKIRGLNERVQQALKLAACIGNTFELSPLAAVSERGRTDVAADLFEAVDQGLVMPIGESYKYVDPEMSEVGASERVVSYRFLHDRVQEAAYALIAPDSKKPVHLRVGRLLLASTPEGELEARIFEVVNQLDIAVDLIDAEEERLRLSRLNLLAGEKAKASMAYPAALRYFSIGLDLVGDGGWELHYDLAFALARERAECLYLTGGHDEADAAFDRLLRAARATADKREIYQLKVALYMSVGKHEQAIKAGLDGIRLYGMDVDPDADLMAACDAEEKILKERIGGRPLPALVDTPDTSDPERLAVARLMFQFLGYGTYTNPFLFQLLAMKMVNFALEGGNAPGTSLGYVTYAMRVGALHGDYAGEYELGRVALAHSDRLDRLDARSIVKFYFGFFVSSWRRPMRECFGHLEQAFLGCTESGSLFMAACSGLVRVVMGYHGGEELRGLREHSEKYLHALLRTRQFDQGYMIAAHVRCMHLLSQGSLPPNAPEHFQVDFILSKLGHFPMAEMIASVALLRASLHLGDWEGALAHAKLAEERIASAFGIILEAEFTFYQSILFTLLPPKDDAERQARRQKVEANLAKLARWADASPENFAHKHTLVKAELSRLDGDDRTALELYDRAAELAGQSEFIQNQALANELAAKLCVARGRRAMARAYLAEARYGYATWGAKAKVAQLEAEHPHLLPRSDADAEGDGIAALDLAAVLRASQAISGEIVLDELLKTLMRTLLQNAGARRGVLILGGDTESIVAAHEVEHGAAVVTSLPAHARAEVALSIVRYVERSRETVVVGDATRAGQFQTDPYLAQARAKSILCTPVRSQTKVVGVLYLENDLVTDAFTPERCRVLEMLASQAAISLENARLYDTLETRVKERTQELRQSNEELSRALARLHATQKQLVTQEKLASLGALTSGIAHEIKNPLNFVNNFAEASMGLVSDLVVEIDRQRERLKPDGAEALSEIAADLELNAAKIREHGVRADGILRAMLEHSRVGPSERREADLNAVVRDYTTLAQDGFRSTMGAAEAKVSVTYDDLIGTVELATQDVGRVLLNLIKNALYATLEKKKKLGGAYQPEVRVGTRDAGDAVEIRVWDNGTGVAPAIRDSIFAPFFTTKPPGEGTGLGLSISHEIVVQGNGGTLAFISEEGEFTEFVVSLPKRRT